MQKRFSTTAILTLVAGLVVVVMVLAFSSTSNFNPSASVTNIDRAKTLAEQYASSQGLDLHVKEIMEFSDHYYVIIQEDSSCVNAFEVLVDKATGRVFLEPGPTMMWNTKYGHMRSKNPNAIMPLSIEQALQKRAGVAGCLFPRCKNRGSRDFLWILYY